MVSFGGLASFGGVNFSFSEGLSLAKPLGLFIIGLAIYSFFIFKFYKFLARREIFTFSMDKAEGGFSKFLHGIFYFFKYLLVFPVFMIFWVMILSVILAFLSKNSDVETLILISVALVGVIRVMAYYDEDLSKDLAKMMPFALLGVFLVDISFFSTANTINTLIEMTKLWRLWVYYLFMLILIEFILRIFYSIVGLIRGETVDDKT